MSQVRVLLRQLEAIGITHLHEITRSILSSIAAKWSRGGLASSTINMRFTFLHLMGVEEVPRVRQTKPRK